MPRSRKLLASQEAEEEATLVPRVLRWLLHGLRKLLASHEAEEEASGATVAAERVDHSEVSVQLELQLQLSQPASPSHSTPCCSVFDFSDGRPSRL